ncbi:hypothetical protein [Paenibacillus sp. PL91]|uniref:hypothetical protein n=1 Tax=Paenibacillus sp. PL91 TaxID=2729538 RepID=UPI00145FD1CF|nr:hypothetical protein [Paenibacillus sp. PL91]MBC9203749.1 hypothetical protein [Paenibacillus sp. PL91]
MNRIEVTSYYSAPTAQQVSESINSLYENWISYVDIQKGILRGPEELKELYEDYREKVAPCQRSWEGYAPLTRYARLKWLVSGVERK